MLYKIVKIFAPFLQKVYLWYFSKPRNYSYKNIKIIVLPGVFYPGFILSTGIFLKFIEKLNLSGKKVLELGAGSGIISVLSALKGAIVTASDINPTAIENISRNAQKNGVQISTVYSDLFTNISEKNFDFIFINPPFYNREAKNFYEMAWFCGEQFEYFVKLFRQLKDTWHAPLSVYMILSEDCDIKRITQIAFENNFELITELKEKKLGDLLIIYRIVPVQ